MDIHIVNLLIAELSKEQVNQQALIKTLLAIIALIQDERSYKKPKTRPRTPVREFIHYLLLGFDPLTACFDQNNAYLFAQPDTEILRYLNKEGSFQLKFPETWIPEKNSPPSYKYDVCISYASEDGSVAEELAKVIKDEYYRRVFFDDYEKLNLWGDDLYKRLYSIYSEQSHFCIILLSANYIRKNWTNHELRAAQSRALKERKAYILPILLEQIAIPIEFSTIACLKLGEVSFDEIADNVNKRVWDEIGEQWIAVDELAEIFNAEIIFNFFMKHFRKGIEEASNGEEALIKTILTLVFLLQDHVKPSTKGFFDFIIFGLPAISKRFAADNTYLITNPDGFVRRYLGQDGPLLVPKSFWEPLLEQEKETNPWFQQSEEADTQNSDDVDS